MSVYTLKISEEIQLDWEKKWVFKTKSEKNWEEWRVYRISGYDCLVNFVVIINYARALIKFFKSKNLIRKNIFKREWQLSISKRKKMLFLHSPSLYMTK